VTNQTATQCCATCEVNFTLATNTFTDPCGGTLAYAATLSNGAPLPSWLTFNAATETFTGTMPTGTMALAISVTATNKNSLSASETFVAAIAQVANQFGQAMAGSKFIDLRAVAAGPYNEPRAARALSQSVQRCASADKSLRTAARLGITRLRRDRLSSCLTPAFRIVEQLD
jgi:Putative Ig domain